MPGWEMESKMTAHEGRTPASPIPVISRSDARPRGWKIALMQANPVAGDWRHNADLVRRAAAENADADLIVTSEMFALGYPIEDFANRPDAARRSNLFLDDVERLALGMGGPAFLVGCLLPGPDKPFNAMCLIEADGSRRYVTKAELPNNGPFDEVRNFAPNGAGRRMPLNFRGLNLGICICEDIWHGPVAGDLAAEGAHMILIPNGSPFHMDWDLERDEAGRIGFSFHSKQDIRLEQARRRVRETGLPLVYVNQVGGQDELVFDGGTFAMDDGGMVLAQTQWDETVIRLDVTLENGRAVIGTKGGYTGRGYQSDPLADLWRAMMVGGADYVRKTGAQRVALGLSGGLDSAVTAVVMADALGPQNVLGVTMPSQVTSNESNSDAFDLADRTGIHLDTIAIGDLQALFVESTVPAIERLAGGLGVGARHRIGDENSQARLRGMSLMAIANKIPGTLVFSTGNKSETAVGYCTAYGDMCGGYNILKDLPKTLVKALAAWRNENQLPEFKAPAAPIPVNIITKKPSAELSEGQTDEDALGPYELLDPTLKALVEDECSVEQTARRIVALYGEDAIRGWVRDSSPLAYIERIADLISAAEWKRRQAPIGTKLTGRSFGRDRRYPVAGRCTLRNAI